MTNDHLALLSTSQLIEILQNLQANLPLTLVQADPNPSRYGTGVTTIYATSSEGSFDVLTINKPLPSLTYSVQCTALVREARTYLVPARSPEEAIRCAKAKTDILGDIPAVPFPQTSTIIETVSEGAWSATTRH